MITDFSKRISASIFGVLLLALSGCGTLTGATLGGAAGAGIGAATHSNVGRAAAIGAGIGGTAGAIYDIAGYHRHNRDYYD
jgi:osmotically inducible lipoprotein OsmB